MQAFRKGEKDILVATDVAARGIDIPTVGLVIKAIYPALQKIMSTGLVALHVWAALAKPLASTQAMNVKIWTLSKN